MVDSKILVKVVEFCKYHHESGVKNTPEDEATAWDKEFVKTDDETLFNMILVRAI